MNPASCSIVGSRNTGAVSRMKSFQNWPGTSSSSGGGVSRMSRSSKPCAVERAGERLLDDEDDAVPAAAEHVADADAVVGRPVRALGEERNGRHPRDSNQKRDVRTGATASRTSPCPGGYDRSAFLARSAVPVPASKSATCENPRRSSSLRTRANGHVDRRPVAHRERDDHAAARRGDARELVEERDHVAERDELERAVVVRERRSRPRRRSARRRRGGAPRRSSRATGRRRRPSPAATPRRRRARRDRCRCRGRAPSRAARRARRARPSSARAARRRCGPPTSERACRTTASSIRGTAATRTATRTTTSVTSRTKRCPAVMRRRCGSRCPRRRR